MSLEHAILVSLLEQPASGYELARRFDRSIGRFWTATHQQIYRGTPTSWPPPPRRGSSPPSSPPTGDGGGDPDKGWDAARNGARAVRAAKARAVPLT
ncbi:PadR family transcriptional regulator [Micromonospora fulviviridis]|uniref:PadR family transcriptional regulator n=1 Tax=Micromonospora fulviviridis TaxID=47860 RepID=A0ABV2VSS6_9ACTN